MGQERLLLTHKPLATQNNCAPAESYQNLIRRGGQNPKTVGIPALLGFCDLFPLNRPSGLGGQVKHYAVDAVNLMRDAGGDVVEKRIGNLFDGGRHGVGGVDRTDDGGPALVALAVLYADTLHVRHSNEVLPDLAGKTIFVKFFPQDRVG